MDIQQKVQKWICNKKYDIRPTIAQGNIKIVSTFPRLACYYLQTLANITSKCFMKHPDKSSLLVSGFCRSLDPQISLLGCITACLL